MNPCSRRRGVGLLTLLVGAACRAEPALPSEPIDRPVHSEVGTCGPCHLETAAQFRASSMYRSSAGSNFQVFFRVAQRDLGSKNAEACLDCHRGTRQPLSPHEGISCQTCHFVEAIAESADGQSHFVYGSTVTGPQSARDPKHAYEPKTFFENSNICAPCHKAPHRPGGLRLSTTFESWSETRMAQTGIGCLDCHMEDGSHTFIGGNNDLWAGEALDLRLVRSSDRMNLHVENVSAGHDFPSDATDFRELEVRARWMAGEQIVREETLAHFGACQLDERGRPVPFWRARSTNCQLLAYDKPARLPVAPPGGATALVVEVVYHRISRRLAWVLPEPSSLRSRSSVITQRTIPLTSLAHREGATSGRR